MKTISVLFWLCIVITNQCEGSSASRAEWIYHNENDSYCVLFPVIKYSKLKSILLLDTLEISLKSENHTLLKAETLYNPTNKTRSISTKPGISVFKKYVQEEGILSNGRRWNLSSCVGLIDNSMERSEIRLSPSLTRTSLAIILLATLCLILYWQMTMSKLGQLLNRFPGHPILPLIGSAYIFMSPNDQVLERIGRAVQKYGRCLRVWLFYSPYVIITEAKSAQTILSTSKHIEKGRDYEAFRWLMGNGLITSSGQKWHEDRKLLNPSFKYQRFDGFLNSFNKHSKVLVNILKKKYEKVESPGGCVNLHPILSLCTMDFVTEAALGKSTSFQNDSEVKFVEAAHMYVLTIPEMANLRALASFRRRIIEPWFTLPIIWHIYGFGRKERNCRKYFEEALGKVIEERRVFRSISDEGMGDKTKPFIDALLDAGKSGKEIIDHVITIFGAGFETTASAMNYTLFLLSSNPECQAKAQQELDSVFSCEDSQNMDVTFAHLAELKYLEMCIKEAMRLYPPAPAFMRAAQEDIELENGLTIPKGCDVAFLLYELHRDPQVFPDPEKFDPHRFLPEECAKRSAYAYAPFSVGPRGCIGQKYAMMQMKTALAHILRNFAVYPEQKREKLKVMYGMVLEPLGGIHLKLTARNKVVIT